MASQAAEMVDHRAPRLQHVWRLTTRQAELFGDHLGEVYPLRGEDFGEPLMTFTPEQGPIRARSAIRKSLRAVALSPANRSIGVQTLFEAMRTCSRSASDASALGDTPAVVAWLNAHAMSVEGATVIDDNDSSALDVDDLISAEREWTLSMMRTMLPRDLAQMCVYRVDLFVEWSGNTSPDWYYLLETVQVSAREAMELARCVEEPHLRGTVIENLRLMASDELMVRARAARAHPGIDPETARWFFENALHVIHLELSYPEFIMVTDHVALASMDEMDAVVNITTANQTDFSIVTCAAASSSPVIPSRTRTYYI